MRVGGAWGGVVGVRRGLVAGVALALIVLVGFSGCRIRSTIAKPTPLPSGVYANAQYHFSVRYPSGWNPNVTSTGSTIAPIQVAITRSSDLSGHGSVVSTFTVALFDAKNATIAQTLAGLPKQAGLRTVTLAGMQAYATTPATQSAPGSVNVTHTEYYLVAGGFEYQISTDAVQGDGADNALNQMLASFQITR